jgi:peptidoglycan/xylan/chitin deacetylase (PgdA/CDA1 family)
LEGYHAHATVFVTGIIADRYPSCITAFPHYVDIGSQGYTYTSLNSISDYTLKLQDVKDGKQAIDDAGSVDSRLFKAPYGDVDENIYSLLRRSQIVAEFSYPDHYNLYHNGTFVKYDLVAINGSKDFRKIDNASGSTVPLAVNFYNSDNLSEIDNDIKELRSRHEYQLISSSDLANMNLTVRHETSAG